MKNEWKMVVIVITTVVGGIVSWILMDWIPFGCAMLFCTSCYFVEYCFAEREDEEEKKP